MKLTIYRGYNKSSLLIMPTGEQEFNEAFAQAWGKAYRVDTRDVYNELDVLNEWAVTEFGEECVFDLG